MGLERVREQVPELERVRVPERVRELEPVLEWVRELEPVRELEQHKPPVNC